MTHIMLTLTASVLLAPPTAGATAVADWRQLPPFDPYNYEDTFEERDDANMQTNAAEFPVPTENWQATFYKTHKVYEVANNNQTGVPWSSDYATLDPNGTLGLSVFGPTEPFDEIPANNIYYADLVGTVEIGAECWVDWETTELLKEWRARDEWTYVKTDEYFRYSEDEPEGPGGF